MGPRDFWLRLRALFTPHRVERELDDELTFHIEMQTRKYLAAGLSAMEARRRAHAQFGSTALIEDECRDARGIAFLDTLWQDVRYAVRGFRRTPTFALTVIGTIALGLGLNVALFTVFNAYVLRPEGVSDPKSLYLVQRQIPIRRDGQIRGFRSHMFTRREYDELRRENEVFSDTLARRPQVSSRINGTTVWGQLVSGNYFEMLGVGAVIGRTLMPDDSTGSRDDAVVVLGYAAWQRLFAADPGILGRKILISGYPCEVVGVALESFSGLGLSPPDFWAPLTLSGQLERNPGLLDVIGRLKPGITTTAAQSALTLLAGRMTADRTEDPTGSRVLLESKATLMTLSSAPQLLLLIVPLALALGLVLVIACANVANLMLARAIARQREIGVRFSLGASHRRIVRQLLTESLLLALSAALLGLIISQTIIDSVSYFLLTTMPAEMVEAIRVVPLHTDIRILGFLLSAAAITALLFGLLPALQATKASLVQTARGDFGHEVRPGRARSALVVLQVTASALLLICAGVLLRASNRANAIDFGIRTTDVLEIAIEERSRSAAIAALEAEPIVASLAATWPGGPLGGSSRAVSAAPDDKGSEETTARFTSAGYFDVLDIALLNGRTFTEEEAASGAAVAVVSQTTARRFWPDRPAIGQTLRLVRSGRLVYSSEPPLPPAVRVIGVVRDVNGYTGEEGAGAGVYVPIGLRDTNSRLLARVHGDPEAAKRRLDGVISAIDPRAVQTIRSLHTFVAVVSYPFRIAFWVSIAIGILAMALTVSGLYGVLSYLVTQRTKEIGIRIALGATVTTVTRMVLGQSLRLIAVGLASGAFLAWAASKAIGSTRFLSRFLTMIDPRDPVAYVGSLLVVLAACIVAASVPALRAARIDPIATLRHD